MSGSGLPSCPHRCPLSSFLSISTHLPASPTLSFPVLLHSPEIRVKKKLSLGDTDQTWLEFPQVRGHVPLRNEGEGKNQPETHERWGSGLHLSNLVFFAFLPLPLPTPVPGIQV